MRTENLLKQSQSLAQELQSQQQELQETNRRLEQQAKTLQASENMLTQQQDELKKTNEELEEKARLLAIQNQEVERKNREIEQARLSLEEKAEQLALTSKYKSEFLANMSHELRTPLNSLLILSKLLAENAEGNLTPKQVEFAQTVHAAGSDLLALINDILDLSKIESGTMTVDLSEVHFKDMKEDIERAFSQVAADKNLEFEVSMEEDMPGSIYTDEKRLNQVLKNLLSNAFKFTDHGNVTLDIRRAEFGWTPGHEVLDQSKMVIAFSVRDTGIGIAGDKQKIIFEAFQQADGTTSRKYGGTGLGLAISREIATLLGGEIRVSSEPGMGSTFTFYVPAAYLPHGTKLSKASSISMVTGLERKNPMASPELLPLADSDHSIETEVHDDRGDIQPGDKVLLIVEDDPYFASLLLDLAHEQGFKGLITGRGEMAIVLAKKFNPDAITLDIKLIDMDGWTVLDRLKHDNRTRHIPVHVISIDNQRSRSLKQGAIGYLQKPVTKEALNEALGSIKTFIDRHVKNLLVVEPNEEQRAAILDLIAEEDVNVTMVSTAKEALEKLNDGEHFDCVVLDIRLPDMNGTELIKEVQKNEKLLDLPIIIYTGKDLSPEEESDLKHMTEAVIVRGVRSPERLLDETSLFLHRVEANLPEPKKRMLETIHRKDPELAGRKVLIIDDDVRNIFAITSVLERQEMKVLYAENGIDGIDMLKKDDEIDCILLDLMMPGMDGYEAMKEIRNIERYKNLPIIALTAKAMKGDREKCIDAGASDYVAKPVDPEQLLSLLRVWLFKTA
jgi:CheY-like chemotaxis protein/signal transduction histidine kinase